METSILGSLWSAVGLDQGLPSNHGDCWGGRRTGAWAPQGHTQV